MKINLLFVICIILVSACTVVTPTNDLAATQNASTQTEVVLPTATSTPSSTSTKVPTKTNTPSPTLIPTQTPTITPSPWPGYEIAVIGAGKIPYQLRFDTNIWEYKEDASRSYNRLENKYVEKCDIAMASFADGGSPKTTDETRLIGANTFHVFIIYGNGIVVAKYTLITDSGDLLEDVGIGVTAMGPYEICLKDAEQVVIDSTDLLGIYK